MLRISTILAVIAVVFLTASIASGAGLLMWDLRSTTDENVVKVLNIHRLTGILGGCVVLLVNSVVITYFIGTGRWVREVSETYHLENTYPEQSAQLKRRTFPASLTSMFVILVIAFLGANADPGAAVHFPYPAASDRGMFHLLAVCFGVLLMGYCYVVQRRNILTNQAIITAVVDEVQQVRIARGLDQPAAEKLQQTS